VRHSRAQAGYRNGPVEAMFQVDRSVYEPSALSPAQMCHSCAKTCYYSSLFEFGEAEGGVDEALAVVLVQARNFRAQRGYRFTIA